MLKKDKLINWYRRGEQSCWRLLEGDCTKGQGDENRTVIATFMPDADEDTNFDEGEQNLLEQLEELTPGVYTLETRTTPTATKSRKAVAFRCYTESDEESSVGRSSRSNNDFDDFIGRLKAERESAIAQAREEFARELQIHDLERDKKDLEKRVSELTSDNKDLEKRASEIEEKKVNYIGQAVAAITGMFMPQQQPAIGVVDGAPDQSDEERLKQVVFFLRQKEPDCWLDLLEGIVRVAKTEPQTYNMARGFLIRK